MPTATPTPVVAYLESQGEVVVEAERAAIVARGSHHWAREATIPEFAGTGYVSALPDRGSRIDDPSLAPELRIPVRFATPGTYRIHARIWSSDRDANSINVGIDGAPRVRWLSNETTLRTWTWASVASKGDEPATITVRKPGLHWISVWMHEDGARLDRLVITTSGTAPAGAGPAESARG